jgi:hypothetical protein
MQAVVGTEEELNLRDAPKSQRCTAAAGIAEVP